MCQASFCRIISLATVSVVDDNVVFFQNLFRVGIQLIGNFMDMIFLATIGAAHSDPGA